MKLGNLPDKETTETFQVKLKTSQAARLRRYQTYAQEVHGIELTHGELLTSMVTSFMDQDQKFLQHDKKPEKPRKPATDSSADRPAADTDRPGGHRNLMV